LPARGSGWTNYDRQRAASPSWSVLHTAPPGFAIPDISVWERFAGEVRAQADRGLRVCVSSETFGNAADPAVTRRIIQDLGGERVHVVYATRALYRLLPSHWQQEIKVNFETRSFDDWLQVVLSDDNPEAARKAFWYAHDLERAARTWLEATTSDKFTVIATDDSDRRLIPQTVETMLGLPDRFLHADERRSNPSLGVDEVEVLRQVNVLTRERGWPKKNLTALVQGATRGLSKGAAEADSRRPLKLPHWAVPLVTDRAREHRALIDDLKLQVVGDPDCLLMPDEIQTAATGDRPQSVQTNTAAQAIVETIDASLKLGKKAGDAPARQPRKPRVAEISGGTLAKELLKRVGRRMHVR